MTDLTAAASEVGAVLKLKLGMANVGRAEHTCAFHIESNYAQLADLTLFAKDTAAYHNHLGISLRVLVFCRRLPPLTEFFCARPPTLVDPAFNLSEYKSETCWRYGRCYANESFTMASVRPFGRWLTSNGIRARGRNGTASACYGGFFAASRDAIRSSSREVYARVVKEVSIADSLEAGHYLERAWPSLFHLRHLPRSRFVRVAVYTAMCGRAASQWGAHHTAGIPRILAELPGEGKRLVAEAQTTIPLGLFPGDVCDGGGAAGSCEHDTMLAKEEHKAFGRGSSNRLQFLVFSDSVGESEAVSNATSHGWRVSRLPAVMCQARLLKMVPHRYHALADFDYVAYVTPDAALGSLTLDVMLSTMTHTLASFLGPVVSLIGKQSTSKKAVFPVEAVVRRVGGKSEAFGELWHTLSNSRNHTQHDERIALDAALRQSGRQVVVRALDT